MKTTPFTTINLEERLAQSFDIFFMGYSEKSLEDISKECGFSSYKDYLFEFRKRYRCTPWEYRARLTDEIYRDWYGDGDDDLFESNWE